MSTPNFGACPKCGAPSHEVLQPEPDVGLAASVFSCREHGEFAGEVRLVVKKKAGGRDVPLDFDSAGAAIYWVHALPDIEMAARRCRACGDTKAKCEMEKCCIGCNHPAAKR